MAAKDFSTINSGRIESNASNFDPDAIPMETTTLI